MGIESEILKSAPTVFRRIKIKRRSATTGLYEPDWQDISSYIKTWGSIGHSVDDTKLFKFKNDGLSFKVINTDGKFNPETNPNSLWYGYLTRNRSLIKVEAGYVTSAGAELPTDTTQGIFILDDKMDISGDSDDVTIKASSLQSIFDDVIAAEIPGLNVAMTASDLITKIRDHTDGAGVSIFQQFIPSASWSIQATTNNYIFPTDSTEDLSVWELMEKVTEAEGNILFINRTGGLVFKNRDPNDTVPSYTFYGQGFGNQNVKRIKSYYEALDKLYSFFRVKYIDADTSTSFVEAGTTTVVNASNLGWKQGNKTLEIENTFISNTATAQAIVNSLYTNFSILKSESTIEATLIPQLEVLDRIAVNYHSYNLAGSTLWDVFDWDSANWSTEYENFDWNDKEFYILSKRLNLDDFTHEFKMREV